MTPETTPIEKARHGIMGLIARIKHEVDGLSESHDPEAARFKENAAWMIKAWEMSLEQIKIATPRVPNLETFEVHDAKVRRVSYDKDMGILELVMLDGLVRWHDHVDQKIWDRVKGNGDLIEGYYMYIFDKVQSTEQRPQADEKQEPERGFSFGAL